MKIKANDVPVEAILDFMCSYYISQVFLLPLALRVVALKIFFTTPVIDDGVSSCFHLRSPIQPSYCHLTLQNMRVDFYKEQALASYHHPNLDDFLDGGRMQI